MQLRKRLIVELSQHCKKIRQEVITLHWMLPTAISRLSNRRLLFEERTDPRHLKAQTGWGRCQTTSLHFGAPLGPEGNYPKTLDLEGRCCRLGRPSTAWLKRCALLDCIHDQPVAHLMHEWWSPAPGHSESVSLGALPSQRLHLLLTRPLHSICFAASHLIPDHHQLHFSLFTRK